MCIRDRIGDADQLIEEALARVHGHDVEAEFLAQVLLDADKFILAQDAIVDEDAGQLAADGLVDQHGRNRRVYAAGEPADHVPGADFGANRFYCCLLYTSDVYKRQVDI